MPHHGVGPEKNIGIAPENAAADFRRVLGSSGTPSGPPPDAVEQEIGLSRWARGDGRFLDEKVWLELVTEGGEEHDIFLDTQSNRVVKITTLSGWGRYPTIRPHDKTIGLRPATPLEYFDRMALSNQLFGDDVVYHGVVKNRHFPRIVISQSLVVGRKSTPEEIDDAMRALGFLRIAPGISMFENRQDGIAVVDGHSGNFLTTESGQVLAIDVIPAVMTPEIFSGFEVIRRSNR